jgi:hypothetical protein
MRCSGRRRRADPAWMFSLAQRKLTWGLMWQRALLAFLGSLIGAGAGIGLLVAAFIYLYRGRVGEGVMMNVLVSVHIFLALALAAAIWGSIVGGMKMGLRAGFVCLEALLLSGPLGVGLLMLALQLWPTPEFVVLWPITIVVATLAAAVGAAFMGWRLGGKRLLWRSAVAGSLPTGLIFAVPLTTGLLIYSQAATLVLLFIPFIILATYLGTAIDRAGGF